MHLVNNQQAIWFNYYQLDDNVIDKRNKDGKGEHYLNEDEIPVW